MRIRINTTDGTVLPLIGELPDWPLARMEGYNGIGKSLTVRLLQVCTGVQPYRARRAWSGLREGLGECEVIIDGLAEDREVRWVIDSRRWPTTPEPVDIGWEGLQVQVDGRPATMIDVAKLVSVHRLAGDVGLAETLGEQIEADRIAFEAWSTPLADFEDSPLRAVEDRLGVAADLLRRVDFNAATRAREARTDADEKLDQARQALADHTARQTALADALALRDQLTEARGAGQAVEERLTAIDAELTSRVETRGKLAAQIEQLEGEAARSNAAAGELQRARRRYRNHHEHLEEELDKLADLAELVGIAQQDLAAEDPADDFDARLTEVRAAASSEMDSLLERRAAIDAAPMISSLLHDLAERLESAEADGLGRQPLLDPSDGLSLTVADLRSRLEARRSALGTAAPSEQGTVLVRRMEEIADRLRALEQLPGVRAEIARRRRLAGEADEAIRKLVADVDSSSADRLKELVQRRDELDAEIHALSYERTSLLKRRSPADAETIQAQLRAATDELGTSVDDLADELQVQAAAARDAQVAFDRLAEVARAAGDTAAEHQATLQRVVRAINDDEDLQWLRRAHPTRMPKIGDDAVRQIDALRDLSTIVSRAADRAGRARGQVQGISQALKALHDRLGGRPGGISATAYVDEVTAGYGREFAGWFDEPHVRSELFGDAVRVTNVDLHADRLEVVWESVSGERRSRPLEAFSRGEQAFAYTRARLAALDSSRPRARNRLIVLDEFGAFIAHNRLSRLVEMLAERRDRNPDDQHLLVLPVANDYAAAAQRAPLDERDALQRKARELGNRGFIIEQL